MITRRRLLIALGWLFIATGSFGILSDVYRLSIDNAARAAELEAEGVIGLGMIWGVRMIAILGGVLLIRGVSSGRWILLAWMVLHVGISALHSLTLVVVHLLIFAPITYVLFTGERPEYVIARRGERR